MIFYYGVMWAFGGITNTTEALKYFESNFRIKVEELGKLNLPLLDYFFDIQSDNWVHWSEKVSNSWENIRNVNY